jgi:hypothetical protein
MKLPATTRFLGLAPSQALEATIHAGIAHIERTCLHVTGWNVTVRQEAPQQHQAGPYSVRVDASLPGQQLAVTRGHDTDVHMAVRDALAAMRRKLEDAARIRAHEAKEAAATTGPAQRHGEGGTDP